jgi:hypothetical protein
MEREEVTRLDGAGCWGGWEVIGRRGVTRAEVGAHEHDVRPSRENRDNLQAVAVENSLGRDRVAVLYREARDVGVRVYPFVCLWGPQSNRRLSIH